MKHVGSFAVGEQESQLTGKAIATFRYAASCGVEYPMISESVIKRSEASGKNLIPVFAVHGGTQWSLCNISSRIVLELMSHVSNVTPPNFEGYTLRLRHARGDQLMPL